MFISSSAANLYLIDSGYDRVVLDDPQVLHVLHLRDIEQHNTSVGAYGYVLMKVRIDVDDG
jgi:hypothetical protein